MGYRVPKHEYLEGTLIKAVLNDEIGRRVPDRENPLTFFYRYDEERIDEIEATKGLKINKNMAVIFSSEDITFTPEDITILEGETKERSLVTTLPGKEKRRDALAMVGTNNQNDYVGKTIVLE